MWVPRHLPVAAISNCMLHVRRRNPNCRALHRVGEACNSLVGLGMSSDADLLGRGADFPEPVHRSEELTEPTSGTRLKTDRRVKSCSLAQAVTGRTTAAMDQRSSSQGNSTWNPTYPSGMAVDESLKRFLADFYAVSDDPNGLTKWVDSFADDAVLIMGSDVANNRPGAWASDGGPLGGRSRWCPKALR